MGDSPPYIHSSRNSHTSSYSYLCNSHKYSYSYVLITMQLIQPSLMQPGPVTDTLSKIETSGAR